MGWFTPKCDICHKKEGGFLSESHEGGIYDFHFKYHDDCLRDAICEPHRFTHQQVDMALFIHDTIQREKRKEERRIARLKSAQDEVCKEIDI